MTQGPLCSINHLYASPGAESKAEIRSKSCYLVARTKTPALGQTLQGQEYSAVLVFAILDASLLDVQAPAQLQWLDDL